MKSILTALFVLHIISVSAQNRAIDSIRDLIEHADTPDDALVEKANLVVRYYMAGQIKKQNELLRQTLKEARALNSSRGLGAIYKTKGVLLYYESKFDSAMHYFEMALPYMRAGNDKPGMLKVISNIGSIYYMKMDYRRALEYFDKGLKLEMELKYREGEFVSLNNVATVYYSLQMPEKALKYFRKAQKVYTETDGIGNLAFTYDGLSNFYQTEKQYDSAMYYARKCLEVSESIGDKSSVAYSFTNIGLIFNAQKKYNQSIAWFRRALPITYVLDDKRLRLAVFANIAASYIEMNMLDSAYSYVEKVVPMQEELRHRQYEGSLSALYAEYYARRRDFEKAYNYLSMNKTVQDSLYDSEMAIKTAEMQEKYETEKKDKQNELLKAENKSHVTTRNYLLVVVGLAILSILGGLFAFSRIRRANRTISHQKQLVEEKQKEVLDSINYARRIQFALLASEQLLTRYLPEHFVLFKPKDVVSGDFYWATPAGDEFLLLTGDCTGHGVPGAFMSLLNITKISQVISEKNITRPDLVLNEVRREIISVLNPEGHSEKSSDGMDAVLYSLNRREMTLQYAAANNSFYIVRNNALLHCKADKMPVGKGYDDQRAFTLGMVKLEPGDSIYTFTDGFGDQFGGPAGKKFKSRNLEELILKIHREPMEIQRMALDSAFDQWRGNLEQVDDVCVIGVRIN